MCNLGHLVVIMSYDMYIAYSLVARATQLVVDS